MIYIFIPLKLILILKAKVMRKCEKQHQSFSMVSTHISWARVLAKLRLSYLFDAWLEVAIRVRDPKLYSK